MTHSGVARELREEIGLTDALIRISIGIENVEDLISDLAKPSNTCDSKRELGAPNIEIGRFAAVANALRSALLAAIILIAVTVVTWLNTGCAPGNC